MATIKSIERSDTYCKWNILVEHNNTQQLVEAYLEKPDLMADMKLNVPLKESFNNVELDSLLDNIRAQLSYSGEIVRGFFDEAMALVDEKDWPKSKKF